MIKQDLFKKAKAPLIVNNMVSQTLPDKTMTRRLISTFYDLDCTNAKKCPTDAKDMPNDLEYLHPQGFGKICGLFYSKEKDKHYCSGNFKHRIGDVLWIREPATITNIDYEYNEIEYMFSDRVKSKIFIPDRFTKGYGDNADEVTAKWIAINKKVPNGCLREMARYFIIITGIKIERLQDISYEDCYFEGLRRDFSIGKSPNEAISEAKQWFMDLWDTTAPISYAHNNNPFVITYSWQYMEYK